MSASIPPNGPPKATVTHECGDVRVTVREDLTPMEAYSLAAELHKAAFQARKWLNAQLETIEEAGK